MPQPRPGADPTPQVQRVAAPSSEVLAAYVEQVYAPLTDDELAALRPLLDDLAGALAAIAAFPLDNADEPMPVFAPYRVE
jgi:hypothetical protein